MERQPTRAEGPGLEAAPQAHQATFNSPLGPRAPEVEATETAKHIASTSKIRVKGKKRKLKRFPNIRELFLKMNDFSIHFKKKKEGKKKKDIRPRIDQEVVVDHLNGRTFLQESTPYVLKIKTRPHIHTNATYKWKKEESLLVYQQGYIIPKQTLWDKYSKRPIN